MPPEVVTPEEILQKLYDAAELVSWTGIDWNMCGCVFGCNEESMGMFSDPPFWIHTSDCPWQLLKMYIKRKELNEKHR